MVVKVEWNQNFAMVTTWNLKHFIEFVLVITCLAGQFGINCPSAFLKILKLSESNVGNFKIFKNHEGDLSQKAFQRNMWLLVNHTKPTNVLYHNLGNYKSGSGQFQNSRQLQNNTAKSAMLITINRVIIILQYSLN